MIFFLFILNKYKTFSLPCMFHFNYLMKQKSTQCTCTSCISCSIYGIITHESKFRQISIVILCGNIFCRTTAVHSGSHFDLRYSGMRVCIHSIGHNGGCITCCCFNFILFRSRIILKNNSNEIDESDFSTKQEKL